MEAAHEDELPRRHSHGSVAKEGLMPARVSWAAMHSANASSRVMAPRVSAPSRAFMDALNASGQREREAGGRARMG